MTKIGWLINKLIILKSLLGTYKRELGAPFVIIQEQEVKGVFACLGQQRKSDFICGALGASRRRLIWEPRFGARRLNILGHQRGKEMRSFDAKKGAFSAR